MLNKKRIAIFGITGTIGLNTIDCLGDNHELVLASYYNNQDKANEISEKYKNTKFICLKDFDLNSIKRIIDESNLDLVVNAISGWDGLIISKLCLENNIDLALANKESYVIGNKLFTDLIKSSKSKIYPIDSEHSSLFELLKIDSNNIEEIFITASGGPFLNKNFNELKDITFSEAVKHPNWNMGEQISLDSSTMVNKFYELVEASYITDFKIKITPIIHKQSIVHSFVRFKNNSYLMNASYPDMKISIDLAINDFNKKDKKIKSLDFKNISLDFQEIDENRFIPIKWFNEFFDKKNYVIPIIVNIANEWCFNMFKNKKIKYLQIIEIIDFTIIKFKNKSISKWEDLNILKKEIINWLNNNYA